MSLTRARQHVSTRRNRITKVGRMGVPSNKEGEKNECKDYVHSAVQYCLFSLRCFSAVCYSITSYADLLEREFHALQCSINMTSHHRQSRPFFWKSVDSLQKSPRKIFVTSFLQLFNSFCTVIQLTALDIHVVQNSILPSAKNNKIGKNIKIVCNKFIFASSDSRKEYLDKQVLHAPESSYTNTVNSA